jgi:NAD dependent epimerase/dehydratase family enzyme
MRTLRRVMHRPWSPPVPKPMLYLGAVLLRTDPELALYGRRLMPTRMTREGFTFRFAELEAALKDLLSDRST